jgi:hypothetical protein
MIRRPAGENFWLITQTDHAAFAGQIAEQLGGNGFSPPTPRGEVLQAIADHDAGWPLHDDQPTLNDRGQPLHVFEINMALATRIWSASVDRAMSLDPYSALLVSLHQLSLSDYASRQDAVPHERAKDAREMFELNKFQHRQIEIQEALRHQLKLRTDIPLRLGLGQEGIDAAEDLLNFNFRLLTLCDRLSLQLCCGKTFFPTIEDVRPGVGAKAVAIQTTFVDEWTVAMSPWPFACEWIDGQLPARRVPAERFEDVGQFQRTYEQTRLEKLTFTLRPA